MNTKHTPGPWKLDPSFDPITNIFQQIAGGGFFVATVTHGNAKGREEREANARLIAAAPDLLAALELCITSEGAACFSDMNSHPEYMQRRLYAISDLARAAIAKATGEG